jgi:regulatory protein
MKRKPAGESRLRQELMKRGVSKHDIADAFAEAFPPETSRETAIESALEAAQKKMRSLERKDPEKRKQALVGYLQRQGFSWDVIKKVLADVLPSGGNSDEDE